MPSATSMKDLVEDIQASTNERHEFVGGIVKDVKGLLARFDREQQDVRKELKELAVEIKGLAEETRKFLAQSAKERREDFGVMMKDIAGRLSEISKRQNDVRKDARGLVKEYAADHKKAREAWLSLSGHRKQPGRPKKEEE